MLIVRVGFLVCAGISLLSCGREAPDYSIKRPAALSLPAIQNDGLNENPATQGAKTLSAGEAMKRSKLVIAGTLQSIDSSGGFGGDNRMPVYLLGVKAERAWKGNVNTGKLLYYLSRKRPAALQKNAQLYFLVPSDTFNILAANKKIHWQWTFGAPENINPENLDDEVLGNAGEGY